MKKQKEKNAIKVKKRERGITLIALVITIIVLLILAGVTIAALSGNNGILQNATKAKKETEISSVKEQARLDISNWVAEKTGNGEDSTVNTPAKVQEILNEANEDGNRYYTGYTDTGVTTPSGYEVPYEDLYTTSTEVATETVVDGVKIPKGFYHVEGTSKTGGLVISDKEGDSLNNPDGGNQYVWIPVDGILGEEGKTVQNAINGEIILGRYVFAEDGTIDKTSTPTKLGALIEGRFTETSNENKTFAKDINGFIDSVRKNKGYYIARFEASQNTVTNKAESKYNKPVWSTTSIEDASPACQNLYPNVNSDLMNSYAWDTAILFIQKYGSSDYSRHHGVDGVTEEKNSGMSGDVQLNICDLSGNYFEVTTETETYSGLAVDRGTDCYHDYDYTSFRSAGNVGVGSFRPCLYLD